MDDPYNLEFDKNVENTLKSEEILKDPWLQECQDDPDLPLFDA